MSKIGYTQGFEWTDGVIFDLKDLSIHGLSAIEISQLLSKRYNYDFSVSMINNAKARYKLTKHVIERDSEIPLYKDEVLPNGNRMIGGDIHSPYYDEVYFNRFLAIADKFKIRKATLIGDTLDQDFAKKYYDDKKGDLDFELAKTDPVMKGLQYFDEVEFLKGNHETRIGRITDGKIQAHHIFQMFGPELWKTKFKYVNRDKIKVGRKWLLVHPKSYSQVSGSVAVRLAEKFHRHVINAHGHFIALRYDRSGKYMGIDLGGLFSREKIKYINETTTTHPVWNPGFGMIYGNHFYHFHENTDWDYWLGK